jgi:16S rRNA (cytosine967-C5)-methyltransferase
LWWGALGAEQARLLLASVNEPAESALRVNTLVADPLAVRAELAERGVETRPAPAVLGGGEIPEGLVVESRFDPSTDPLWRRGALVAQSRAAMSAALLLGAGGMGGMRVLDLCAAPGGKATHLAALVGSAGEVVAVERNPRRAAELRRTCERLHADRVHVETGDAIQPRSDAPFDAVLVDPPCSGLGTLQGRPDLRWRARPEAIAELAGLQLRILTAGGGALAPGGTLVYATCTVSPQENEQVVERFLADHADFALDERMLQLLPHRDRTDGFFLARLRRQV